MSSVLPSRWRDDVERELVEDSWRIERVGVRETDYRGLDIATHGNRGYGGGCRCSRCKAGRREYLVRRRSEASGR